MGHVRLVAQHLFLLSLLLLVTAQPSDEAVTAVQGQGQDELAGATTTGVLPDAAGPHTTVPEIPTATSSPDIGDSLDIVKDKWISILVALIPVSMWIGSSETVSIWTVLCIRLIVIIVMNFVNKESVQTFPVFFLLSYQCVIQSLLVAVFNFRNMTVGKWRDLAMWLGCLTPFWAVQLGSSLFAFKSTSVSAIQIIRSLNPIMGFACEACLHGCHRASGKLIVSMLVVVFGTTVYASNNVSVTPRALFYILLNCSFCVFSTVCRRYFLKDKSFSVSLPLAMSSVSTAAAVCALIASVATGEVSHWNESLGNASYTAWFWATMSGLTAGCFSLLQGRSQQSISATSDLMYQTFTKFCTVIMGILLFADAFSPVCCLGCLIALGGCAWYGYIEVNASAPESGTKARAVAPEAGSGYKTDYVRLSA